MATLTIFANFFIDTQERFLRMKDSFLSFHEIKAEKWVINIRGRYREDGLSFLEEHLGDQLIAYRLNSEEGWFHDTRQMLKDIQGDCVLFWIEDHINIASIETLNNVVDDFVKHKVDIMRYSVWRFGKLRERYSCIDYTQGNHIDFFLQTIDNNELLQEIDRHWIITAISFVKNSLFKKIISTDDPIPPRWPKETPFDFEKEPFDTHWLPLVIGIPREEYFVAIDDDMGCEGYSLISRGLYPERIKRQSYTQRKKQAILIRLIKKIKRKLLSLISKK